jgi:hypothetical protein
MPFHVGTCTAAAPGVLDPRGICVDTGPGLCGSDGLCDGAGGCQRYPAGTVCAAESCEGSTLTPASTCDGQGTCVKPTPLDCGPFFCDVDGVRCASNCAGGDAVCAVGYYCAGNEECMRKKAIGTACTSDHECVSNACADGVCCGTACGRACTSCALPGQVGTCAPVPAGTVDPQARCATADPSTCGLDGTCDGAGACRRYEANTVCSAAACSGAVLFFARRCDGAGTCRPAAAVSCAPYACDPSRGACNATCASPSDCAAGFECGSNGICGTQGNNTCVSDAECASGFCTENVCCASRCDNPCFSCAVKGSIGTCVPDPYFDPVDPTICQ